MDVFRTKTMAEIECDHLAKAIVALEATDYMGAQLRRYTEGREEYWQVVLVDRREE